jgi:hypothetical protein
MLFRVLGRLVLIPFLECQRSPSGLNAQQLAENEADDALKKASSALGMMVGLSRSVGYLCQTRLRELQAIIAREIPNMDDRCTKNYALLISFAEMVSQVIII